MCVTGHVRGGRATWGGGAAARTLTGTGNGRAGGAEMLDQVVTMLLLGIAVLVLMAVAVTVLDATGAGARRERAADRRRAWEAAQRA